MRRLLLLVALAASPALAEGTSTKTQLKLDVKPAHVVIYLDGKVVGKANRVRTLPVTPGRHRIKLVRDMLSHEEQVVVKRGETKVWEFQLGEAASARDEVKLEDEHASPAEEGTEKDSSPSRGAAEPDSDPLAP